MRVIIHIKNDGYFCHPAISVTVELPDAPQVGDTIHLDSGLIKFLEEDITTFTKKQLGANDRCCPNYYECTSEEGICSLSDYFYCVERAFFPMQNQYNRYELHIELGAYKHLKK